MSPMQSIEAAIPAPDLSTIALLTPEAPELQREMASYHAAALVRHLIALVAEGQTSDPAWRADVQSSIAAMQEVLR